jgi:uncharacterized membrane protein YhaH (DUF805 family)
MHTEPGVFEYMMMPFKKFADFSGRSRRKEYWFFNLLIIVVYFGLAILTGGLGAMSQSGDMAFAGMIPLMIFLLVIIVPSLAVTVRRLHDIGKSGWWILISLVPIASLVLFVFSLMDSEPGANKWGPNPKNIGDTEIETIDHLINED